MINNAAKIKLRNIKINSKIKSRPNSFIIDAIFVAISMKISVAKNINRFRIIIINSIF
jgi:hypothetical protein